MDLCKSFIGCSVLLIIWILATCQGSCQYNGQTYAVRESFPAGDGCNRCICNSRGPVICTEIWCPPPVGRCEYNGETYAVGAQFPAVDGCNSCHCETVGVNCTQIACSYCYYKGTTYIPGQLFEDTDACLACICETEGRYDCRRKCYRWFHPMD